MTKIYRVQMNKNGAPNFSTAEEVADRPKGEWKWQRKIDGNLYHRCSECGYSDTERDFLTEYKFCPQCGADMRGEDNEAD